MKFFLVLTLSFVCLGIQPVLSAENCPPANYTKSQLLDIKQSGFQIDDSARRNELAIALMACVGDPDPELRDGIVYEGTATWLRGQNLTAESTAILYDSLLEQIAEDSDEQGFQQPFAALLLSEVARTDRIEASFAPEKRAELVGVAAKYLENVRDYRGFSESEGWRHGVAHGADLVLQLVLNENISGEQVSHLMAAVAMQISPHGEVFYIYGEPGRLARTVFYAYRRGIIEDTNWQEWFAAITDPKPLKGWDSSYSSQAGLAKRHNTLAFLTVLNLYAGLADDEQSKALAAMVIKAIKTVL